MCGTGRALRDAGTSNGGRTHLCQHLIEPLQRAVQVQLDPAGGAGHRLSPVGHMRRAQTDVKIGDKSGFRNKILHSAIRAE